ncbi:MAG: hypothetical protein FJ108_12365 [Deltaproteobacteria bacterium]|nr:hypothetical protein [Deltaproteobacteria bacterium]
MSGIERVLEISASTRVLRERRGTALDAARGGALLGREFLHLRALAERCAAETGAPFRDSLGATALARLVAVCAQASPRFGPIVAERPGLAAALAGTLRDLRDAGIAPGALPDAVADLRALYTDLERALARLAGEGLYDRIGLFQLAVRGAPAWVARRGFTRAEVHGATEVVGSAGDLVDAIAGALPEGALRFFQPDWGDAHAERVRAEWAWRGFTPEGGEVVDRPALDRDGAIPTGRLRLLRARSPREELELVAREVLALLEAGTPPREILIVARSLEPYGPWLEPIFGGYGIPVTSSLSQPAVANPEARAWLDLLRALGRDLERGALLGFLDAVLPREQARLAERLAREAAVVRGEHDWLAALDAARPEPGLDALRGAIARAIDARRAFAASRSFAEAASIARALGADLPGDDGRAALEGAAGLDAIERAAGAAHPPTTEAAAAALESLLLELATPWRARDDGGVRVLDAIQARALPCEQLFLLGMNHGAWPHEVREDPFLSDAIRESLCARLRRPIPIRARALAEERFLLGLLLSQARARVTITFAEADGAGRALSPSGFLRNLPFVAPGSDVVGLATVPSDTAPDFARAPAAVTPSERDFVAQTDAFHSDALPFDGGVGAAALRLPDSLSPSFVAELGVCPLRAFARSVLGARELEDPSPDALDANEAGQLAHDALRRLYRGLFDEGRLAPGTNPDAAIARATASLPGALAQAAEKARTRVRTREPGLWAAHLGLVERAIRDLLERDLRTLLPTGVVELETERSVRARVQLHGERGLELEGRVDRIVRAPDGALRVGDYKTSRDFAKPVEKSRVKHGTSLQVPLYALAVASEGNTREVIGEALPVPLRPERDPDRERDKERSLELGEIETLALPVLDELHGLLARGLFPFWRDRKECRYCAYTIACRREHGPSRERLAAADSLASWRALRGGGDA